MKNNKSITCDSHKRPESICCKTFMIGYNKRNNFLVIYCNKCKQILTDNGNETGLYYPKDILKYENVRSESLIKNYFVEYHKKYEDPICTMASTIRDARLAYRFHPFHGRIIPGYDLKNISPWNVDKNSDKNLNLRNYNYFILMMPSYIWRKYPEVEKLNWTPKQ